jgi:parvulin-like peptidyl-prolyl isomerase
MTLRAKPVARRDNRPPWQSTDRRNFFINLGFVVAIVAAVVILVAALVITWYDGHLAPAAKVGGVTITKDQFAARYNVETFRIDYAEARLRTLVNLGYMTSDQEAQQLQYLDSSRQQLAAIALERLIDAEIQSKLAVEAGINVSDADIDAQMTKEATIDEQRRAWVIEVAPEKDPGVREPSTAQKAAAKAKAEGALADLKGGKKWEEVVSAVSTAEYGGENGDLGFLGAAVDYDSVYLEAIFKLPVDTLTEVLEGSDGVFRIGRVTQIGASQVDSTFQSRLEEARVPSQDYRLAVKADVIRERLEDKVVADLSKPAEQRHIQEIYIQDTGTATSATAVKVRHILYAPKDDPAGAAALPDTDPAWKTAEDQARAAYAKLRQDISQFDALARKESDEASAMTTGGRLPYYDENSAIDTAFAAAILGSDHKPGDLLEPVKSSFGWHVIQILHGPTDALWADELKKQLDAGAKFADLARDNSDGPGSVEGGDAGWISRGELARELEDAIYRTPIGSVSNPVAISGDGIYIIKVLAEEVREPTAAQKAIYKASGFSNWYAPRKEAQNPERLLITGL